jgi:hypothetical protein
MVEEPLVRVRIEVSDPFTSSMLKECLHLLGDDVESELGLVWRPRSIRVFG